MSTYLVYLVPGTALSKPTAYDSDSDDDAVTAALVDARLPKNTKFTCLVTDEAGRLVQHAFGTIGMQPPPVTNLRDHNGWTD